jgi:molecular chaperone DnaJ
MASDPYKILGVAPTATADEIKKAYRKLAKQYHPDSTGGDKAKESRFKDISNAYDVLGDEKKRKQFDDMRAGRGGPQGFPGGAGQGVGPDGTVFDIGDLFGQFFGGARGGPGATGPRGPRVHFEQSFGGGERTRRQAPPEPPPAEARTKATASDGSELTVEGNDVYSDVRISFDRAILGTVVTVATLHGKGELKIPPGTSSGRKMRLRGKGVMSRGGKVGDHYVTIQIDVPAITDDEGAQLVTQLALRLATRRAKAGHGE